MKKLKILTLAFLLVVHSFLGVTPIAFAEEDDRDVEEIQEVELEEGNEISENVTETVSEVTEENEAITNEESSAEPIGIEDEGEGDNLEELEPDATGDNFSFGALAELTNYPDIELTNEQIREVTFKVDGQVVEGTTANVRNGQNAEFTIDLEDIGVNENDRNYGPGTKLKYPLPTGFADVFEGISVGGTFGGLGNLSVESGYIVIELTEEIDDGFGGSKPIENGFFTINAQLSNNNTDWNKQVEIPGGEKITLNFQPKQGTGTTINKSNGTYDEATNQITWTVIVNTNLNNHESGTVTFTDTLTATGNLDQDSAGHKYDTTSVEVYEIEVTPRGPNENETIPASGITPDFSNGNKQMSLTLAKDKAYKIVYKTIPDNPGINESVTYRNTAKYDGSSSPSRSYTKIYGKAIEKKVETAPSGTNLTTTWKINYNFHNQVVPSGTELTDSWTISGGSVPTGQTGYLKMENLEIYQANGTTVWGGDYDLNYTLEDDEFSITFNQNVTEPLVITYNTTPVNLYVTSNFTVANTASHGHITQATSTAYQTYSQTSFTLVKNKASNDPNYQAKTMDWIITANQAGYTLNAGTTFTDTFENENMYLKEDTLNVKIGNTTLEYDPDNPNATNGVFTLTNNDEEGFVITLVNSTTNQVTISYTTDYVIKDVVDGDGRAQTYPNKVQLSNTGLPSNSISTASYTINEAQKANGNKIGHYNYETKTFHWEVVFNYNYNTINEAIFKDQLPADHVIETISVTKGDLTAGGAFNDSTAETVTINDSTIIDTNQIYLNLGTITKPHKVVYTSKVANDIISETPGNYNVTNEAELYNGTTLNASWDKTVTVQHTEKVLAQKNGSQIGSTMGIKWNFHFNTAQSSLDNVVIADTFAKDNGVPNQIIDPSSIKVYKVQFNGTNSSLNNRVIVPESEYTLSFEDPSYLDAAFVLELGNVKEAYYIEYESVFIGLKDSPISNSVEVKYFDTKDDSRSSNVSNLSFNYGSHASTSAAPFVIVKTDAATGEPMKDVEFTLQNRDNRDLLTGTTDEHGVLDFGYTLATGTYKLKEKPVAGYDPLNNYSFVLSTNPAETYAGKQVVRVENTPEGTTLCEEFILTAKDVDGKPVTNVTLINLETDKEYTNSSGVNGEFAFSRNDLPAGKYTVKTDDNGTMVTLAETVTVKYANGCELVVQPDKRCSVFTVTIEDNDGNPRIGAQIKLVDSNDSSNVVEATEVQDGKYTVPNTTEPGQYKVYEGNQYLGEVEITYKNDCEATVIEAPACETFTLTVKDVNGEPREAGVEIIIKDENGTEKARGTTVADGKVTINSLLEAGEYEVYEASTNTLIAQFTTNTDCEAEVQPAPSCENFKVFIKDKDGNPREGVTVTVKDSKDPAKEIAKGTTDSDGKIEVPCEILPYGDYKLYEGDVYLGPFTVDYIENENCEVVLSAEDREPVCEDCTITLLRANGQPFKNVPFTLQDPDGKLVVQRDSNGDKIPVKDENDEVVLDEDGNTVYVTTFTTDEFGKFSFLHSEIKSGIEYTVYENGKTEFGTFIIEDDCEVEIKQKFCDAFTVTVTKEGAVVEEGTVLTFKSGTREVTGTTDANGNIIFAKNDLPEGTYVVYDKDGNEVGAVDVTYEVNKCQAAVNVPIIDPEDPEQPGDPDGEDQEDPTDPEKPGGEDPEEPSTPGTDDNDDSNHLGGSTNDKDGDKTGISDIQKGDKQPNDNGQALPQTGEARNINLLVGGVVSILIGLSLILFRRKPETV